MDAKTKAAEEFMRVQISAHGKLGPAFMAGWDACHAAGDTLSDRWREKYYDKVTELNAAEANAMVKEKNKQRVYRMHEELEAKLAIACAALEQIVNEVGTSTLTAKIAREALAKVKGEK